MNNRNIVRIERIGSETDHMAALLVVINGEARLAFSRVFPAINNNEGSVTSTLTITQTLVAEHNAIGLDFLQGVLDALIREAKNPNPRLEDDASKTARSLLDASQNEAPAFQPNGQLQPALVPIAPRR